MASTSKQTPRQKMIGMMYLVLTALLALNVSKEVLDGYNVVNSSVLQTNNAYSNKRQDLYSRFENDYRMNQIEVGPFYERAKKARKLSSEMTLYIENLRNELIAETEDIPLDSAKIKSVSNLKNKDNYTIPTNFLIGLNENGEKGRANQLKIKLIEFRHSMLDLIHPNFRSQVKIGLQTEGDFYNASGVRQNWEMHHFYEIPLAADIPILNKLISEVNNAEVEILDDLMREISADDYRYDKVAARILPKSNFLFTGEQFEAEVIVAAYDTTQTPNVYLKRGVDTLSVDQKDQATKISGQNGSLKFSLPVSKSGMEKFAGFVSIRNNSGKVNNYHFKSEFYVASPSLTVSATKMNVLFVGVNNPVSISVAGITADNIIPVISAGTLKKDPSLKNWIAKVPANVNQVKIDVFINENGSQKKMGTEVFRVKRLPDPDPFIAKAKSGFVNRENLIIASRIIPKLPGDFEFDYTFKIQSFNMSMQRGFNTYKFESESDRLTDEMIREIKKTNRGQVIIFDDIIALGPEGATRTLNPLIITLN